MNTTIKKTFVYLLHFRKRTHPPSGRSLSPVEIKKTRDQSPVSPAGEPVAEPLESSETEKSKKLSGVAKDGKKIKKKKKEGKVAKAAVVGEGLAEGSTSEELKPIKGEKKIKKEKKLKEKGAKKKKKSVIIPPEVQGPQDIPLEVEALSTPNEPDTEKAEVMSDKPMETKIGKKRKQDQKTAEPEVPPKVETDKPKKKKKKKHQPEVLVQPWNDLEGDDEQQEDVSKSDDKPVQELSAVKCQDDVFSDWSDDGSPVGDDPWLDEDTSQPVMESEPIKELSPVPETKPPAFDDVYDPISDDEFDAMYTHSDDEELAKDDVKETTNALGVEEVDWSSLGIHNEDNKGNACFFNIQSKDKSLSSQALRDTHLTRLGLWVNVNEL